MLNPTERNLIQKLFSDIQKNPMDGSGTVVDLREANEILDKFTEGEVA